MIIEYKELEYLMENYLETKGTVEIISNEEEMYSSFAELNEIFGHTLDEKGYLNSFKVITFSNQAIYTYVLTSLDKAKKTKYIVYTENDKPKCLISYSKYEDKVVTYTEENYTVYQEDSNYIDARMKLKTTVIDGVITLDVNTLNYKNNDYLRNDYSIYYSYGDIIGIRVNDDKYFRNSSSYLARRDMVLKDIEVVSKKINNKITDCFSDEKDNLKEYKIRRKDR